MRALVLVFSLFSVAAVEAAPLPPAPVQPQAQAQSSKLRYRGLEKMLRRFSREAGEARTRG